MYKSAHRKSSNRTQNAKSHIQERKKIKLMGFQNPLDLVENVTQVTSGTQVGSRCMLRGFPAGRARFVLFKRTAIATFLFEHWKA